MPEKIFGTDIDIPLGESHIDILGKFKALMPYLEKAESLKLVLLGNLEQKPAFRIRLQGTFNE